MVSLRSLATRVAAIPLLVCALGARVEAQPARPRIHLPDIVSMKERLNRFDEKLPNSEDLERRRGLEPPTR